MAPYNPPNAHYAHINLTKEFGDISYETMMKIMGEKGENFKQLTTANEVKYVWWNKELNVIEIWGSEHKMEEAKNNILKHITKICKNA